jgi:hypothetical protein
MSKDWNYYGYANEHFMNFGALKLVNKTFDVNVSINISR